MRTILIMLAVLVLSAGGFYAYLSMQVATPRGPSNTSGGPVRPQDIQSDATNVGDIGPGARPWVKVYDKERRLSYRFRAREYAPERAGRIEVRDPEAEFFQYVRDDGEPGGLRTQRIQLVGKTGEVEVQQGPQASADKGFDKGSAGPPKRGLLTDVTIRMFHRFTDGEPKLTITAPNVAFDNETFEIATRSYNGPNGALVPPDQVPIVADGADYAFKGRGLNLRWNDVDGRLEHLEIAHGDYLQIKNPSAMGKGSPFGGGGGGAEDPATKPAVADAGAAIPGAPAAEERPEPLVTADAAPPAISKRPNTRPAKPKKPAQPPYRATFDRDVRISEGDINVAETDLARADVMYLDFQSGSAEKPSTRPASGPAAPTAIAPAERVAILEPPPPATPDTQPAAATRPATQPVQKPIIVRWSGKLRVAPLESASELASPLKPGESVLRFLGQQSPVLLTRGLNRVDCTAADYFTGDRSVLMRGSDRHGPVVLRQLPDPTLPPGQSRQAKVVTQLLSFDGKSQVAKLTGKSNATITLPRERSADAATQPATLPAVATTQPGDPDIVVTATSEPPQVVHAAWSQGGTLWFKDGLAGEMTLDHADFAGDVDVNHPQLALKSQHLALRFEERIKPATRPATQPAKPSVVLELKQVVATADVWADLIDADGQKQTVTTDQLTVDTATDADGKLYPRIVTAAGNAHAFDEKQSLRAGGVELTMAPVAKPATKPVAKTRPATAPAAGDLDAAAVELKRMRGWDGVVVSSADGSTAAGETMDVTMVDGHPLVRLMGKPLAAVTDPKGNSIVGPVIDVDPKRSWAKVSGRGSIRAIQAEDEPDANAATQPAIAATRPVKPPKFLDVVWDSQAEMDGGKDRIVIDGPVLVSSTDEDGTFNTASGRRAVIELAAKPAPATRPATRPSAIASTKAAKPATRPTGIAGIAGGGGMDLFKDKTVSAVNLEEDAVVNSTLSDDQGVLRQFELKSARVRYEAGASAAASTRPSGGPLALGASGQGRLIVPGAGTMIYRDHRPAPRPATQPAAGVAAKPAVAAAGRPATRPGGGGGNNDPQARGATAFRWNDSLVYDQALRTATLTGAVVIVHQPDTAEPRVQVNSEQAIARFEPKPSTRPANQPAKGDRDDAVAMQLRWLTLNGGLVMTRGDSQLTARQMDYNPATGWMVAIGTPQDPATYTEAQGQRTFRADQVHWNTESWLTKFVGLRGSSGTTGLGTR